MEINLPLGYDYDDYEIKYPLAKCVLKGEWKEVIQMYKKFPLVHGTKIASSGGTALHIAVSDVKEDTVDELVKIISDEALLIKDELGNTPLHIAAAVGSVRMCRSIAEGRQDVLLLARNLQGESPFFLAALRGHKDTFLCLHSLLKGQRSIAHCRRNNGDTVLHCAISEDHFELALGIIELYPERLANSFNDQGISPLHLLCTKPSAFRSGTYLGPFSKIIYHTMFDFPPNYETCCDFISFLKKVVKLATKKRSTKRQRDVEDSSDPNSNSATSVTVGNSDRAIHYPPTYETCCNFISFLKKVVKLATERSTKRQRDVEEPSDDSNSNSEVRQYEDFPPKWQSCVDFIENVLSKPMQIIFGSGLSRVRKIREQKRKNLWAAKILELLLEYTEEYIDEGKKPTTLWNGPSPSDLDKKETFAESSENKEVTANEETPPLTEVKNGSSKMEHENQPNFPEETNAKSSGSKEEIEGIAKGETPLLTAAKNGISEMVRAILKKFPEAIYDKNSDNKNAVLLAAEHRRSDVYGLLDEIITIKDHVFGQVDNEGNSALHLAASLKDDKRQKNNPVPALRIKWEREWYELVKHSMPFRFVRHNNNRKTPEEIFTETHEKLLKDGRDWYTNTSQSCSVVASLIATVAFATSATVPGGIREGSGSPNLQNQPAFLLFAISSPIALCFSITSVIMFLSILTSQFREKDFRKNLPKKLFLGLFSLFVSMASMLLSFCAGHFFILKDKLKSTALLAYAVVCLPITIAIADFLYSEIVMARRVR